MFANYGIMMRNMIGLAVLCVLSCVGTACHKSTHKYDEGSVVLYADEGFKSFMEQEREVFEYQYPNAYVLTRYMSELDVVNSLLQDSCTLGVISRPLTQAQMDHIKNRNRKLVRQEEIAVDAIAVIVNKDNPVDLLTVGELKKLFSGEIDSWTQLAVNDTTPVKIVFDQKGSANVSYIEDNLLPKGAKFRGNVFAQHGNKDVLDVVEHDKSAIGLVSVSWLGDELERIQSDLGKENMDSQKIRQLENADDNTFVEFTDKVKVLKVRKDDQLDGYAPYQAYIYDGKYPLVRKIYMVSTAANNSVGHSFYSFVTGFIGQKILLMTGILPYHVHPRVVEMGG